MQIYDDRPCELGEGPLWHPLRQELFWFDILQKRLLSKTQSWNFEEHYSAAGWIDSEQLFLASETGLWTFSIATGAREKVAGLEADNPVTRSNDGRADPYGGFWIGTMGKDAEAYAGAIYRYFKGEVRVIAPRITVSNSICFSPDGLWAYFADTESRRIQRLRLDENGWPKGDPEVFQDLRQDELNPDGSVVDAEGRLWNAQWDAGRVACYDQDGFVEAITVPTARATCPAFGGDDLETMFVTSAAVGQNDAAAGKTFSCSPGIKGQAEHQVIL